MQELAHCLDISLLVVLSLTLASPWSCVTPTEVKVFGLVAECLCRRS